VCRNRVLPNSRAASATRTLSRSRSPTSTPRQSQPHTFHNLTLSGYLATQPALEVLVHGRTREHGSINAPADEVWARLADFTRLAYLAAAHRRTRMSPGGEGARSASVRHLTLPTASEVDEQLLARDDLARHFATRSSGRHPVPGATATSAPVTVHPVTRRERALRAVVRRLRRGRRPATRPGNGRRRFERLYRAFLGALTEATSSRDGTG